MAAWINTHYSAAEVQAWVWRVPFLIGGVFGFVAVWLRRWLEETPVFVEMRERRQLARQVPVKQVLAAHRPAVVLSILASWQLTAAIVVVVLLTPTLVQTSFGIAPVVAFRGNSLATLALVFGCLAAGWAVDRIGVGRALLSGSLGLGVAAYALYGALLAGHEAQFVAWYTLAGSFATQTPTVSAGSALPLHRPQFVVFFLSAILLIALPMFFPYLLVGPVAEGLG